MSLPLTEHVPIETATQFFRGLLPEGLALERVARHLRLSTNDTFGLLRELGRDSAGALVITPLGEALAASDEIDWLDESELEALIESLPDNPLGLDTEGEVRLSLAGVQDKLVVRFDPDTGAIGRPLRGTPSTHILKPPSRVTGRSGLLRTPHLVENEAFCMRLAKAAGLNVADVEVRLIAEEPTLIIERYDRRSDDHCVVRIHQEDACQAMGIDPLHKYEAEGGPSIHSIAQVIRDFCAEPLRDLYELLDRVLLDVVIGNLDSHGKNWSFLHHADGRISLAPAYDLVAAAAYPAFAGSSLAMRVGGSQRLDDADFSSVLRAYEECGLSARVARRRVSAQLDVVEEALASALETSVREGWRVPLVAEIAETARVKLSQLRRGSPL